MGMEIAKSIRARVVVVMTAIVIVIAGVSVIYQIVMAVQLVTQQVAQFGQSTAIATGLMAAPAVQSGDREALIGLTEGPLSAQGAGTDIVAVVIRDSRGTTLASAGPQLRGLPDTPAAIVEQLETTTADGEPVTLFRAPIVIGRPGERATPESLLGGVEVAISEAELARAGSARTMEGVLLGLVLVALGVGVAWVLVGRWLRPLSGMAKNTASVAEGDLMVEMEAKGKDEIGALGESLSAMVAKLRRFVEKVQEASVHVASSAGEISANARVINQGAQGQAQAADETSTSMEEMAASIQTVAGNAQNLASYVEETSSSITEMGASIEEVARSSGTLAQTVTEASATIEQMTVSIDRMARDIESLSGTVTETTDTVEEMATFITAVAENAESLGEAAGRTSTTVSGMAGAVTDVAKIAAEADRISGRASEDARSGGEAVARTVEGMKSISENMENTARVITGLGKRSQEIGRILEVIEEIADQTNLLALNAAIEAASAGDAGRGFAVVADEVRKLAERSVGAAKEIGEVVRHVQQETSDAVDVAHAGASEAKAGIALADKAGLALRNIIESVSRSSELMGQIAEATSKQSKASKEVLETVANMNSATAQVTQAVREQAEGSRQIRSAMENIKKVMSQAAYSTREQAAGGRQVRLAVENMNRIASQVGLATREQAEGSRQIINAVERMNDMTQQVSHATAEQRKGGELVVKAMENISEIGRDNLVTVQEMSKAIDNLAEQAENLARLVSTFRVQ